MFASFFSNAKTLVFLLLCMGIALHALSVGFPAQPVWDEVYFATYASAYASGTAFFDIHPPLGKLILGLAARIAGVENHRQLFEVARRDGKTEVMPSPSFYGFPFEALRVTVAAAGVLLAPLFFLFLIVLGVSRATAFLGGLFVLFDTALLLQSRLILLDVFLLLFGLLALVFAGLEHHSNTGAHQRLYLLLAGACAGFAASVKLTGFGFLGFLIFLYVIRESFAKRRFNILRASVPLLFCGAIFAYGAVFALHSFWFSHNARYEAITEYIIDADEGLLGWLRGDSQEPFVFSAASMSRAGALSAFEQIMMVATNFGMESHAMSSPFLLWPLLWKPIAYWPDIPDGITGFRAFFEAPRIMFVGNPVVWWGSAFSLLLALGLLVRAAFAKIPAIAFERTLAVFLFGFAINFVPFAFIPRPMFLYHYLPALLFAIIVFVLVLDRFAKPPLQLAIGVALITSFVALLPFVYGFSWRSLIL